MKIPILILFIAATLGASFSAAGTTSTFTVLAKLGGTADGWDPNASPVLTSDGSLYGMTQKGGTDNLGTIFKLTSGGVFTTLYTFTGGNDGSGPQGSLILGNDGNLYGCAPGGTNGGGTFFRVTTAGVFTVLHSFDSATEGVAPVSLIKDSSGNFYGTALLAGTSSDDGGSVMKITPTGAVTVLHLLIAATDGSFVNSNLVFGSDGALYGSTQSGGPSGFGTIFRVTTTSAFSVLADLTGFSDQPLFTTLGDDGKLYGVQSGSPNSIFSMTNSGTRSTVYTFTQQFDGYSPSAYIQGSDGNFYGLSTRFGAHGYGTFFEITAGGTFSTLYAFPSTIGGSGANGLVQSNGTTFVVSTPTGGTGTAGAILQLTTAGAATPLHSFISGANTPVAALLQGADGNFYGTTEYGGATNDGTIFQMTPAGGLTVMDSFNFATTGGRPQAGLTQDPVTGTLYGNASTGGADYVAGNNVGGTIFGLNPPATSPQLQRQAKSKAVVPQTQGNLGLIFLATLFDDTNGGSPLAQMRYAAVRIATAASNVAKPRAATAGTTSETFSSTAARGGMNDEGCIYTFTTDGTLMDAYDFGNQAQDGSGPESGLVQDSAGNFYGTTAFGGSSNLGTIYKITANGTAPGTISTLVNFTGANGASPGTNELVVGTNGLIYGTTTAGGAYGEGVVFSLTASGGLTVLHSFNSNSGGDGSTPMSGFVEGADGNFYGTTAYGGGGAGILYSITPAGTETILHSFAGADGSQPKAGLTLGTDGSFYGITSAGGNAAGVLFRFLPPVAAQSFSAWETSYSITSGPSATPKNDGVPNYLKYLFNIDPTAPMTAADRAALPTLSTTTVGSAPYLTLSYRQYTGASSVPVNFQISSDLKTWTTITPTSTPIAATVSQIGTDATTGDPIMQYQVPESGAKEFIRLDVVAP
jgi:uncharacterized repeat protein (TIGR03803 family)